MYIHRNFTHPGGVSPMKQEKVEEKKVEEKKKKKKAFDYSKKQDYSGEANESVQGVIDFITPQNNLELGLEMIGGGAGVGIGKGVSKLAKTKLGQKVISKIPWLKNLTKPITKGTKGTKKADFDFSGKNDYSTGSKPKGGVDSDLTTTQPFPENVKTDNDMLKIQQDAFESSTMPRFNRLVDNVADYRGGGKISNPQNLADNMPFAERLEFIAKNGHKDDWLFRGGVTKKGKKYFDAHGVEIPLDPKVDYVPPGLRR